MLLKHFRAILKKVRHFVFTNLTKMQKIMGIKMATSITKVRENDLAQFSKTFKIRFKFESLKIA